MNLRAELGPAHPIGAPPQSQEDECREWTYLGAARRQQGRDVAPERVGDQVHGFDPERREQRLEVVGVVVEVVGARGRPGRSTVAAQIDEQRGVNVIPYDLVRPDAG